MSGVFGVFRRDMKKQNKEIFVVESCVCDYAVIDTTQPPNEQIIYIFNSRANALTVAEILNTDYMQNDNGSYVVWKDKQVAALENKLAEEKTRNKKLNYEAQKYYEDAYCNGFQNQTAIVELEKVKDLAEDLLRTFCQSREYQNIRFRGRRLIEYYDLIQGVDKQIKALKGGA